MPCNMGDRYQHSMNESLRCLTDSAAHKVISCWWFLPHAGRCFMRCYFSSRDERQLSFGEMKSYLEWDY